MCDNKNDRQTKNSKCRKETWKYSSRFFFSFNVKSEIILVHDTGKGRATLIIIFLTVSLIRKQHFSEKATVFFFAIRRNLEEKTRKISPTSRFNFSLKYWEINKFDLFQVKGLEWSGKKWLVQWQVILIVLNVGGNGISFVIRRAS